MNENSFEKEFTALRALGSDTFVLRGSSIIVELQEPEEIKTAGGIIVAAPSSHTRKSINEHRVIVGKVLMTGPGYWVDGVAEDTVAPDLEVPSSLFGHYEPLEVSVGAIVLMPQHSYTVISHFPGISRPTGEKLAMVKMDSIVAYYPSAEAYEAAKAKLNP
jgi:hypothetical protein